MTPEETRAALEWIAGEDTGMSSKTIWAVMMGVPCGYPSIPYDVDDFGRCYRLIKKIPAWRARLPEVVAACPRWESIVKSWEWEERRYLASSIARYYGDVTPIPAPSSTPDAAPPAERGEGGGRDAGD